MPSISVVIPVKNEGLKIRACIEGILSQTVEVLEIIVVDSGSTDDTLSILSEYDKVRVIEIPGSEFNHGETRNLGVNEAKGEYVLLTVGDARACDDKWIEHMLNGFKMADNVAGVCGLQVVPHDKDKNPLEWFKPISEPEVSSYSYTKEEFEKLSAEEKRVACGWDDVTAMYRRDLKLEIPFRRTTYAEDAQWAKDALLAGHTIVYNPAARVYHYHLGDPEFSFKRNYTVMYHMYKFFDQTPTVPEFGMVSNLKMINALRKSEGLSIAEKYKWWKYNLSMREGLKKAAIEVNDALNKGEEFFDRQHQEYCGKPPIPKKVS